MLNSFYKKSFYNSTNSLLFIVQIMTKTALLKKKKLKGKYPLQLH